MRSTLRKNPLWPSSLLPRSERYYGSIERRDQRAGSAGHRRELGRLHPSLPEQGQPTLLLVHAPSLSRLTKDERRQEAAGHERPRRECHADRPAGVRRQRTGWLVLDRAARNVRPARALENDAPSDSSCDPDLGRTLLLRDSAVPRPQRGSRAPPGGLSRMRATTEPRSSRDTRSTPRESVLHTGDTRRHSGRLASSRTTSGGRSACRSVRLLTAAICTSSETRRSSIYWAREAPSGPAPPCRGPASTRASSLERAELRHAQRTPRAPRRTGRARSRSTGTRPRRRQRTPGRPGAEDRYRRSRFAARGPR
jgi:hypothetical protein